MQAFYNALNNSPWKGCISEVGLGIEFTANYLLHSGSSKTILYFRCDQVGVSKPKGMRAVSLEAAQHQATNMLRQARLATINSGSEVNDHLFGLAVTGAHYTDRPSHGWIALKTLEWEAHMHFTVATNNYRPAVAKIVAKRIAWFLDGCLLNNKPWVEKISVIRKYLDQDNIDVLYAPGISDFERLLLLTPDNPLVYHNGEFHRVVDYVREYPLIYAGSFWPPTKRHLEVSNCLFEISQKHYYKGDVDAESLLHRVRMLDLEGRPTLLTQAPRFVDKHRVLAARTNEDFTFILGTDAWNATIAHHQYPSMDWLGERMTQADFSVMPRDGIDIYINGVSKTLQWSIGITYQYGHYNSTEVRESDDPGGHEYLTDEVGRYVTNQRLFQSPTLASTV